MLGFVAGHAINGHVELITNAFRAADAGRDHDDDLDIAAARPLRSWCESSAEQFISTDVAGSTLIV